MGFLRRVLVFLLSILFIVLVVGGGALYYKQGGLIGHNMNYGNKTDMDQEKDNQVPNGNLPGNQLPRVPTPQEIAQIHAAFLNQYIEDINQAIGLINQANGLITSDSFFANPPVVDKDALKDTPFDFQSPSPSPDAKKSVIILPEGYVPYYQENMQNVHRGVYRLAQGMTLMNQILDRMNEDVSILRKNPYYVPPLSYVPSTSQGYMYPQNIPGTNMPTDHGTMTTNIPSTQALSNGLYVFLILMFLVAFIAIGGFILSLFRKKLQDQV